MRVFINHQITLIYKNFPRTIPLKRTTQKSESLACNSNLSLCKLRSNNDPFHILRIESYIIMMREVGGCPISKKTTRVKAMYGPK